MGGSGSPYLDMSDAYANNIGTVLSFEYVPTGKAVYFKAFITALNEAYNTSYSTESGLFGRIDPLHAFRRRKPLRCGQHLSIQCGTTK